MIKKCFALIGWTLLLATVAHATSPSVFTPATVFIDKPITFRQMSGLDALDDGRFVPQVDGVHGYCNDCTADTVCAAGGTGAFFERRAGVFSCSDTSVTGSVTDPLPLNRLLGTGVSPTISQYSVNGVYNVKAYGALGWMGAVPTGSITSGLSVLTLSAAFTGQVNTMGVAVVGAGAAHAMFTPSAPTNATAVGAGATVYKVKTVDCNDSMGCSAASAASAGMTTAATLDATNHILFTPDNTNSGTAKQHGIYLSSDNGSTYALYGCFPDFAATFDQSRAFANFVINANTVPNASALNCPSWMPAQPPTTAIANALYATVSSGAGTTSLTLGTPATTTVSSVKVFPDDTAAIQAALDAAKNAGAGAVYVPTGQYWVKTVLTKGVYVSLFGDGKLASQIRPLRAIRMLFPDGSKASSGPFSAAGLTPAQGNGQGYIAHLGILGDSYSTENLYMETAVSQQAIYDARFDYSAGYGIHLNGTQNTQYWDGEVDSNLNNVLLECNGTTESSGHVWSNIENNSPAGYYFRSDGKACTNGNNAGRFNFRYAENRLRPAYNPPESGTLHAAIQLVNAPRNVFPDVDVVYTATGFDAGATDDNSTDYIYAFDTNACDNKIVNGRIQRIGTGKIVPQAFYNKCATLKLDGTGLSGWTTTDRFASAQGAVRIEDVRFTPGSLGLYSAYVSATGAAPTADDKNFSWRQGQQGYLGAFGEHARRILAAACPYTIVDSDMYVEVDTAAGACTASGGITLPLAADYPNRVLVIGNQSGTNAVTITAAGGDNINGAATYSLSLLNQNLIIQAVTSTGWKIWNEGRFNSIQMAGNITMNAGNRLLVGQTIVNSLPNCANNDGAIAEVTDNNVACVAGVAPVTGSNKHCHVHCDGTNWLIF